MDKEELLKKITELPKVKTNNPISTMNNISVDDLMSAVDRFDKVPTYNELLKENKKQKEAINKAIKYFEENYYDCLDLNSGNRYKKLYRPEKLYDFLKEVSE